MSSIIGQTNGKNSSEYELGHKVVNIITSLAAVGVAAGVLTPEHAQEVATITASASVILGAIWGLYTATRALIKSITLHNQGKALDSPYEEPPALVSDQTNGQVGE